MHNFHEQLDNWDLRNQTEWTMCTNARYISQYASFWRKGNIFHCY